MLQTKNSIQRGFLPRFQLLLLLTIFSIASLNAQVVWDGSESTDWSDGDNWVGGSVPNATDDAEIPDLGMSANYPEVSTSETIRSIDLGANASLSILASGHLIVDGDNDVTVGINCSGSFLGSIRINVAGTLEITNLDKDEDGLAGISSGDFACPIEVSGLLSIHDITQEYDDDMYALFLYEESPLTITASGEVKLEKLKMDYDDYSIMGIYNYYKSPITVNGKLTMKDWSGKGEFYGIYQSDEDNDITIGETGLFEFSDMEAGDDYLIGVYQSDDYNPILVEEGGKIEMARLTMTYDDGYIKGFYRADGEKDLTNHGEIILKDWDSKGDIYGLYNDEYANFINSGLFSMTAMKAEYYLYGLYMEDSYGSIYNEADATIELLDWTTIDNEIIGIYIYYEAELDNYGLIKMDDFTSGDYIYGIYTSDEYIDIYVQDGATISMTKFRITAEDYDIYGLYADDEDFYLDIYGQFIMDDFDGSIREGEAIGIYFEDEEQYLTIHEGGLLAMSNFKADYWAVGLYHYYYNWYYIYGTWTMENFTAVEYTSGIYDDDGYMMVEISADGVISMNNFDLTGDEDDAHYLYGWYVYEDLYLDNYGSILMNDFQSSEDVSGFHSDDIDYVNNYESGLIRLSNFTSLDNEGGSNRANGISLRSSAPDGDSETYGWYFEDGELENDGKVEISNINGVSDYTYGMYNYGGEIFNNPGGFIRIENISTTSGTVYGMYDEYRFDDHENEGVIKIYNIQGDDPYGLYHDEGTFTNKACGQFLTDGRIYDPEDDNDHDFLNEAGGIVVEEFDGDSKIAENQGEVINLNGGTFTVDLGTPAVTTAPANWPYLMVSISDPVIADPHGFVQNILQNTNHYVETYEFYLDEDLSVSAGTYNPNSNSIRLSGTPGSEFRLYLKVTANLGNSDGNAGTCEPVMYTCPVSASIPEEVPTMGQWALILFGLMTLSMGLVFVAKQEKA